MNVQSPSNSQIATVPSAVPAPNNVGQTVVPLIPQDFDTSWRFANIIVKGGMAPKGMESAEKVFAAVLMGAEVGLSPMQAMQNIAVVNGRTAIWGDAQLALVEASGKLEDFSESYVGEDETEGYKAVCRAKRAGRATPIVTEFSVGDAKKAGLWGKTGPWQQHPKRMLKMRARAFALRDGFSDVLKGLYSREELIGEPMLDITPNSGVATAHELNETYLAKPNAEAQPVAPAEPQMIEQEAEVVIIPVETVEQIASRKPTASEIVAQAHAELEVAEAEKKEAAPAEPEEPMTLSSSTNYGLMTGDKLKQAVRQALGDIKEYDGDPEAIAGYWTSINGKALSFALGRKGLAAERAKLDAAVPTAAKPTPAGIAT